VAYYIDLVSRTQLPGGAHTRKANFGNGDANCTHGEELSGEIFMSGNYDILGVDPKQYAAFADQIRDTWVRIGYRLIDDTHWVDGDRTVRVNTPDNYHLTLDTYGDNRSLPQLYVESPCARPDPKPSSSSSAPPPSR
jgi:hypothetical protein